METRYYTSACIKHHNYNINNCYIIIIIIYILDSQFHVGEFPCTHISLCYWKKAFKTIPITDDKERKYIVRTLATVLMSYVDHPRMSDCAIVAKALIVKFPFLADTVGKPHVSVITNNFHAYTY